MRVLVSAASKYGATAEIARAIGDVLQESGLEATVTRPEDVASVEGYDAVILGSAVYAGRWMGAAKDLVDRLGEDLANRLVWLFSSGPVGDPPKPDEDPVDAKDMIECTGAREHRVFAGKLIKKQLSFPERAIVMALRAPEGDFRDWDAIREWALVVGKALSRES
jgi:menaquinone-dependent protoporphyrinogen oxidase